MEEVLDEDFMDTISDISTDSFQESPNTKTGLIQFSKYPKTVRDYAAKVRQIERKIMLGYLTDTEEAKLRKSKYFSLRFEKLLNLSRATKKSNLYKSVTEIYLNSMMMADLQKKADGSPNNLRRKLHTKINHLKSREKAVQEKILSDIITQNDINSFLRDMYFVVKFGDNLALDHNNVYKPEHVGIGEQGHETVVCDYCQSSVEKNRFGQREELLICKDCGNKAHPSCLNYLPELVEQIRADDSWQCIDCKACVICNGTGDPDTLLFCDACDKGYHMQCHAPKLEKMPSGKWACASCVEKGKSVSTPSGTQQQPVFIVGSEVNSHAKKSVTGNGEKLLSTVPVQKIEPQIAKTKAAMVPQPVLSVHQPGAVYHPTGVTFTQPPIVSPVAIPPVQQIPLNQPQMIPVNYAVLPNTSTPPAQTVLGRGVHNNLTHILNPKLPLPDVRSSIREDVLRALPPDVADWTVQDVAYYFKSHGYILESKLLEEQEIDGRAMLLMSRNDCLTGLHIKLGPALKIYHMHIHKLQKRTEFLG
ncbi:uncharacterized protein LOC130630372 [Hydractinia symbiolongicarpus]|uniref:uncharacterized protein LOC130630372 n=1 Tax=Hydractinia symbiolongicarpus TaxID=13093 RepID=UPI002550DD6D|nr:uncharacterized protein LOC130630372 [Hydractinia symbiolongicarpus]